jgi:hypothetical protein
MPENQPVGSARVNPEEFVAVADCFVAWRGIRRESAEHGVEYEQEVVLRVRVGPTGREQRYIFDPRDAFELAALLEAGANRASFLAAPPDEWREEYQRR